MTIPSGHQHQLVTIKPHKLHIGPTCITLIMRTSPKQENKTKKCNKIVNDESY